MFGPRSPRYPLLKRYLEARPAQGPFDPLGKTRAMLWIGSFLTFVIGMASIDTLSIPSFALIGVSAILAVFGLRQPKPLPLTPEQELARRADGVAAQLRTSTHSNRLHRALHPAVATVLEECAGYHARIVAALDGPLWSGAQATEQWISLRQDALLAAKLAMDEAIVHAGTTLDYTPPARPLEHVSDALEDIGFGPLMRNERNGEPMPPVFHPVRDLAERLRELAERCETAATQRRAESPEPVSAAFRHLDATLGEMRQLEEAEGELRQGA